MMAMTTSNSIKVKPRFFIADDSFSSLCNRNQKDNVHSGIQTTPTDLTHTSFPIHSPPKPTMAAINFYLTLIVNQITPMCNIP
jgi:hypothetical protein